MAEIIQFPPDPDALDIAVDLDRPDDFVGNEVDWISTCDNEEEETELMEHNAISLFWIGINILLTNGYPDVPHLLRLVADEVEWQQKNSGGK